MRRDLVDLFCKTPPTPPPAPPPPPPPPPPPLTRMNMESLNNADMEFILQGGERKTFSYTVLGAANQSIVFSITFCIFIQSFCSKCAIKMHCDWDYVYLLKGPHYPPRCERDYPLQAISKRSCD